MSDLVSRLRNVVGDLPPNHHVPLAKEAADEIERLRNTLAWLLENDELTNYGQSEARKALNL